VSRVVVKVGGQEFKAWSSASVRVSVSQLARNFDATVFDDLISSEKKKLLVNGSPVQILLEFDQPEFGGPPERKVIFDGFIEQRPTSYDEKTFTLGVSGRDKFGDIIDCSANSKTNNFKGLNLEKLARQLLKPYGIEVISELPAGADPVINAFDFAINIGDTIFNVLSKAAKQRGIVLDSDGDKTLVLRRASDERIKLILGYGVAGVKSFNFTPDASQRFSDYVVLGQSFTKSKIKATIKDDGITRFREKIVIAEDVTDTAAAKVRAQMLKNQAIGRALTVNIVVKGWQYLPGEIWRPDTSVRITDSRADLDRFMYISDVDFRIDDNFLTTGLTFVPRMAFDSSLNDEEKFEADIW